MKHIDPKMLCYDTIKLMVVFRALNDAVISV